MDMVKEKKTRRIAIIGAGAIGSYYGARLAQAGHDVRFLLRSDYEQVKAHGLQIKSTHGDFHLPKVQAFSDSASIGKVDLVILAWKTTANQHLATTLPPLLHSETTILTLQNGLGNAELLAEQFEKNQILGGLCFVCINRIQAGKISHTGAGLIYLARLNAPINPYLAELVKDFKQANIPCEAVNSLEMALWKKLIWNFPFNGMAIAKGGVDTEVLLKDSETEEEIRAIMREIITIGQALGHSLSFDLIEEQIALTRPMGAYKPSSMIDYVAGKPVEYEAIWENPLKVAKKLRIPTPKMQALAAKIRQQLEKN